MLRKIVLSLLLSLSILSYYPVHSVHAIEKVSTTAITQKSINSTASIVKSIKVKPKISSYHDKDVKLSWKKCKNITGYVIYRSLYKDKSFKRIKTVSSSKVSYVDETVKPGQQYYYKMRVYKKGKDKNYYGDYSSVIGVFTKSYFPVVTKINASSKRVTLYWKNGNGCDKYIVYKKTADKYKAIATISNKTKNYTDYGIKLGEKVYYKIAGVKSKKNHMSKVYGVTPVKISAPQLSLLEEDIKSSSNYLKLTWKSTKNHYYYVLRKDKSHPYSVIKTVQATSSLSSYIDKTAKKNTNYTYSVREVRYINDILRKLGNYDATGLTSISTKPTVNVDFTNLHAKISWKPIKDVDGYEIYRKFGKGGEYQLVSHVDSSQNSYTDVYKESFQSDYDKSHLTADYFIDASHNSLVYTVRGYKNVGGKKVYSSYYVDGDFSLTTPSIVSVTGNSSQVTVKWSAIKNAQKYYVYTGYNDASGARHWNRVATVSHKGGVVTLSKTISVPKNHTYFTVKAVSTKNGETIYSGYDKGYTIENRKYSDENILFFGDSITFGSPYKAQSTREIFSYAWRVQQLTGVNYYNPSIPGATYSYRDGTNRSRMIQIADCLNSGKDVETNDLTKPSDMYVYETDFVNNQVKGRTFKDFDVIVMAAGTNDYLDDAKLGNLDSEDRSEFNGALNTIMGYIKQASDERVNEGKKAIKVVFVDLFYSDRTYDFSQRTNRFITNNKIDMTLRDYQDDIDRLVEKYQGKDMDVYQFHTNKLVNEENCPYVTSDNLHMNRFTYTQIGNELTKYLVKNNILED